jgi:flagellar basal-body rod protein FlgC
MFRSLGIAASGLSAQRTRMDVIAHNIANADVTRGPDGGPYRRMEVVMEAATPQTAFFRTEAPGQPVAPVAGGVLPVPPPLAASGDTPGAVVVPLGLPPMVSGRMPGVDGPLGVRVAGIAQDEGEGRLAYEPGHPDADANGYVRYPDVDTTEEMVKLLDAKRIYEANAAVFQTAKSMLRASLDI